MTGPIPEPDALLSHADFVRRLARTLIRDPNAADDLAQGTLVRALERPPKSSTNLRGWLATVTRNFARQGKRGDERRSGREHRAARPEAVPSVMEILEREAVRSEVVAAVLGLDAGTRDVVLLRYYEDLPPRRIAAQLGLPVETVRTRLKRGLQRLRQELDQRHGGDRRVWSSALLPFVPRPSLIATGGGTAMKLASALTAKTAAAALVVVGGAGGITWWALRTPADSNQLERVEAAAAPLEPALSGEPPAREEAAREEAAVLEPSERAARVAASEARTGGRPVSFVSGRVVDHRGRPIPGAVIALSEDPPELADAEFVRVGEGEGEERFHDEEAALVRVATDAGGNFRAEVPAAERLYVFLTRRATDYQLYPRRPNGRWVDLPATGVDFNAESVPTGQVSLTAVERASGERLTGFGVILERSDGRKFDARSEGGETVATAPVHLREEGGTQDFTVALIDTRVTTDPATVSVTHGQTSEIELVFDWGGEIAGRVVDAEGAPVGDALVWIGRTYDMRGGRMFRPYDPELLEHEVATAADGSFALQGSGRTVTVWHADHNPTTVALADAAQIRLAPRGILTGRLLDENNTPLAGVTIVMDHDRELDTDAEGRFRLEGVAGGVHGLDLAERRSVVVDVTPGETLDVEIRPGLADVQIDITAGGAPFLDPIGGVLAGLDELSNTFEIGFRGGTSTRSLRRVQPGRYVLLTKHSCIGVVDIRSSAATLDLGDADLTVHAPAGAAIVIVPEGANEAVVYHAERFGHARAGKTGEAHVAPLARGRYEVGIAGSGARQVVEVTGPGAVIELGP